MSSLSSIFFTFLLSLSWAFAEASEILINEFMSSNGITLADEDGDFEDWIELYNTSDQPVNIQGYYLSDNDNHPIIHQKECISTNERGAKISKYSHTLELNFEGGQYFACGGDELDFKN